MKTSRSAICDEIIPEGTYMKNLIVFYGFSYNFLCIRILEAIFRNI